MILYVNKNNQQLGPFALAQVQRMVATGGLRPDDLAWHAGITEWIPLDQVPGFADPKAQPPRPKPKRPLAVWVISLWYCLDVLSSLFIGHMTIRLGDIHMEEVFWTLIFVSCLSLKIAVIVCLLRLRSSVFRIILFLMVLSAIWNAHNLWLGSSSMSGLAILLNYFAALFFCSVNILILYFVWQMDREDVMR